jgi:toxin ParE1/3/4
MAIIVQRPRAKSDMAEIWNYIAVDSEARADEFIDLLDRKFQILAHSPRIGRPRSELAEDLRSFVVGRYVIFYLPLPNGIELVRVLHGARDIETAFESGD